MSVPAAGTSKKSLFSQQDHLAPLAIPTGESAVDMVNVIWRKCDVYLDIGSYSISSGMLILWPMIMLFIFLAFVMNDTDIVLYGTCILAIPILMLIHSLFQPTPLPIRFNRQRREVCVPRENGNYWIVPWETVTAATSEHSTVSQVGTHSMGMLFISFDNPDPHAEESNKHVFWGFNCGSSEGAMAQWECMRSYMEIGPHVVKDNSARFHYPKGILATYVDNLFIAAKRKGWFMTLVWEGFCGIFIFNTFLIDALERLKLYPLPDFPCPDIIEWSKPLPPEQWAKRSPELELAIAAREAELAARSL
ncbi:DUF6708 domain-containing protein [Pseudomonas sp. CCC3.1]|uniref:DUF6708 domain-containing protein n=1 Tax=Pseudomonas sp. CCC3.1 TaxID=3048607 RepID=UPI002AC90E00|nr:DUF6708 domain-containing protein [Pseudomonas sp. CCC3.1]MEB0206349.1 hypothetical protein [Pseudomonas sp. CCC3.1]WPX37153.1 hypothetical protein RHM56_02870 [Pseudomonas sp. CCC3.1]